MDSSYHSVGLIMKFGFYIDNLQLDILIVVAFYSYPIVLIFPQVDVIEPIAHIFLTNIFLIAVPYFPIAIYCIGRDIEKSKLN